MSEESRWQGENPQKENRETPKPQSGDQQEMGYSSRLREEYFNNPERRKKIAKRRKQLQWLYNIVIGSAVLVVLLVVGWMVMLSSELPSLEQLENPKPDLASEVYSADGVLLTKYFKINRTAVPMDSISQNVVQALVATEDVEFYDHWGFNLRRFAQTMIENVVLLRRSWKGASTITQQLAKNLYVGDERKVSRKVKELMTAIQIERTYTKREILELYLNTVYFGSGAYGIEAAAWTYFGKPASQLTIGEAASMIGVLKNPARYNPVDQPEIAEGRKSVIIDLMEKAGFITEKVAEAEKRKKLQVYHTPVTDAGIAPYFTEYIRRQVQKELTKEKLDLYRDGLIIYTTLDTRIQAYADSAIKRQLVYLQEQMNKYWKWTGKEGDSLIQIFIKEDVKYKELVKSGRSEAEAYKLCKEDKEWLKALQTKKTTVQTAFVAIDPTTGYIKAWTGGRNFDNYKEREFDRVWQARRQAGSTFKPFVYVGAIDEGIPPNYTFLNQPLAIQTPFKVWIPENSDLESGGETTLRDAIKNSLNQVTIRLAQKFMSPDKIAQYARRMGIKSPIQMDLSIALGTPSVTPLEMTSAYGTFANNGIHVEPVSVIRIEDKFGNVIYTARPDRSQALEEPANYVMVSMLKGVMDGGTAASARFRYKFYPEAGGKTGTSQNNADAWFVGFTPQLVAGVWTGMDDSRVHFTSMEYGQGGRAALPIWAQFMKDCYDDKALGFQTRYFVRPPQVEARLISKETFQFAPMSASNTYVEFFTPQSLKRYSSLFPGVDTSANSTFITPPSKKRGEGEF
ncbi:MAG: PBP1A family penicillin-binding protein [Chloroherpetonaceae bacterium]|nr:PBP1A family penicillin-binding protein [Chloroherpetonaceae bacterium]